MPVGALFRGDPARHTGLSGVRLAAASYKSEGSIKEKDHVSVQQGARSGMYPTRSTNARHEDTYACHKGGAGARTVTTHGASLEVTSWADRTRADPQEYKHAQVQYALHPRNHGLITPGTAPGSCQSSRY
ncbi:hypothetical protein CENSYa_0354 [Cenarchaeum symbiosum A]|uniref:Uncharacterized protein n=1 Tax=Cenarchaeum symbiosum (strain A) TaxID=414004 RepID=A0RUH3_CENSY|nr:hypothetical protein CENSYa_0354 [Cenarchaeum symbiosum A]